MAGRKRKDMQQQQSQQSQKKQHRVPLESSDVDFVESLRKRARAPAPKLHQSQDKTISSDLSSKIIREALKQQREILEENREQNSKISFSDVLAPLSVQEENSDEEEDIDAFDGFSDTLSQYNGGELEIDEEDEKILATFMPKETGPQLTLADIILQKIKERDAEVAAGAQACPKLDTKIINIYKDVGQILSRYTNGKIPKAFKHILEMELWEDALYLTEPQNWSANAMYQATRIFSSNRNEKQVQTFYQNVLLPRIRDDIRKNKRLPRALYMSLKKSLYKPAAFYKGILFPLCEGLATFHEADIIGSIIKKVSIPFQYSSAALAKLAQMDYCGTTRYKNELKREDKDNLECLMQHQKHYLVTPEIKRELETSHNRGEKEDYVMSILVNKPIEEDKWDIPEVPMEED